jgi:hypothetical protein
MNCVCHKSTGILLCTVRLKLPVVISSRSQLQRWQQAPLFSETTTPRTPISASNMLNQCITLQSNTHKAITLQTIPQIVNHVLITLSPFFFFCLFTVFVLFIANGSWYAAAGWYPSSTVAGNLSFFFFFLAS